jgi:hypothetical protein
MGAKGAIILGFFGSLFAALTLAFAFDRTGIMLAFPFAMFAAIALAAIIVMRRPGEGIVPSERVKRTIMWSSIGEGIGMALAANIAIKLGHPEMLLPAMALVVGLHFLPIAHAARFRPFWLLGFALLTAAALGFALGLPWIAGFAGAAALWAAALLAVRREMAARSV